MPPAITPPKGLIPTFQFVLEIDMWVEGLREREHNRLGKQAARETLEYHLKHHIPLHFKRNARHRYGYAKRDPKYVRYKQRRFKTGGMDLVKRGRSRKWVPRSAQIRVGGSATTNTLTKAKIVMRFPFAGGTGKRDARKRRTRGGIDLQQMILEVETFHPSELRKLRDVFVNSYFRQVNDLARRSKRRKITIRSDTA